MNIKPGKEDQEYDTMNIKPGCPTSIANELLIIRVTLAEVSLLAVHHISSLVSILSQDHDVYFCQNW
jgi:hypothetical protein